MGAEHRRRRRWTVASATGLNDERAVQLQERCAASIALRRRLDHRPLPQRPEFDDRYEHRSCRECQGGRRRSLKGELGWRDGATAITVALMLIGSRITRMVGSTGGLLTLEIGRFMMVPSARGTAVAVIEPVFGMITWRRRNRARGEHRGGAAAEWHQRCHVRGCEPSECRAVSEHPKPTLLNR